MGSTGGKPNDKRRGVITSKQTNKKNFSKVYIHSSAPEKTDTDRTM